MTPADMKTLHDRHLAAEARQDIDAIMATFHETCAHESKATAMKFVGKPAVRMQYEQLFAGFSEISPAHHHEAFGDDLLMDRGIFRGTMTGEVWGMSPTGRRVEVPFARVVIFNDSLICTEIAYFDFADFCDQLGVPLDDAREKTRAIAEMFAIADS